MRSRFLSAFLTTLLVAGLWSPSTQAQTADDALRFTQRAPASGVRMMGLAGAGTGGLEDYSALLYNPAAFAYFQHSEAAGAFGAVSTRDDARFDIPGTDPAFQEQSASDYGLANLGYVYKVPTERGSFVLGGALNQVNAFARDLSFQGINAGSSITDTFLPLEGNYRLRGDDTPEFFSDLPLIAYNAGAIEFRPDFQDEDPNAYPFLQAVAPGEAVEQQGTVFEEGMMREFSLGGAVEAAPSIMVGGSVNFSFGSYRFDRTYHEIDQGGNTPDLYDVLLNDDTLLRGFDELAVSQQFESDLTGVNARAGLSTELASGLRAGVVLETPTFYRVEEDYSQQMTTYFDEGGSLDYGGQSDDVGTGDYDYRINSPWRMGGGLAYTIGAFTIAGDVEFIDWSQMRLETTDGTDYFETDNPVNPTIREDFGAVVNTRFGGEYRFERLSVRAGYALHPDPYDVPLQRADGEEFDRTRQFISAGIGYRISDQIEFDMAWMQEQFDDQYLPYGYYNDVRVPGEDATITPPVVDEEVARSRFTIGLRYAF